MKESNRLLIYSILLFSFLLFINLYFLEGIPHAPDSVAYVFMAKLIASLSVGKPIPISPQHFSFFPEIMSVRHGSWQFIYPFGHPLLLSLGVLIGFPNMIPPLVGTLCILMLYKIAKEVYDKTTAFFLLPLPFLSPFFLENASSFMSHTTASFYLTASCLFIILFIKHKKHPHIFYPLLSGFFIGMLFNTRPLTCLPFIIFILAIIFAHQKKWHAVHTASFFLLSFGVTAELTLLFNFLVTKNGFLSSYMQATGGYFIRQPTETLKLYLLHRYDNVLIHAKNFFPFVFSWPWIVTVICICMPLFLKRTLWDRLFFSGLFTLPIVYFFYNGTFLFYGPRFWYELFPFVFLLVSRSLQLAYSYSKKYTLIAFFILGVFGLFRIFGIIASQNPDMMSPIKLADLKGYNMVDNRLAYYTKQKNIHHAIVFINDCGTNWWCYGSVFSQNSPSLTTNIVYAKNLGKEKNKTLINYFKRRNVYYLDYNTLIR